MFRISYHAVADGDGLANDITITRSLPSTTYYVSPTFTQPVGTHVDGDLSTAGTQDAVVGTTAFTTITAAMNNANVAPGDIILINQGSYAETVNDTKTVTLDFVQDGTSILGLTGGQPSGAISARCNWTTPWC